MLMLDHNLGMKWKKVIVTQFLDWIDDTDGDYFQKKETGFLIYLE